MRPSGVAAGPQGSGPTRALAIGAVAVVAAALASSLVGLGNGFALDDIPLIRDNARVHSLSGWTGFFDATYWNVPGSQTLWRPVALLSFAAQWTVGGGAPVVFHAVSIVAYGAVCALVFVFLSQLVPARAALAGGLVFAVHPVHVESVANVVGQLELFVGLLVLAICVLFLRDRLAGVLRWTTLVTIVILYAVALGIKEHALALPALLVALEIAVVRPARTVVDGERARVRILLYHLAAVLVLWLVFRTAVVGGVAGDLPHAALRGLGPGERAWVMLGLVPEFVRLLLWPAALYADYSPQLVSIHRAPSPAHLPGAIVLAALGAGFAAAWSRDRLLALAIVWLPITLALVSNLLVPTGILLAERTLFLPSVALAIAAAAAARRAAPRLDAATPAQRRLGLVAAAGLLTVAAAHSAERSRAWKDNETMIAALLADAPQSARGHLWRGDDLLRAGRLREGEQAMHRAMALWPEHQGAPLGLALAYQRAGLCAPVRMMYGRVLEIDPIAPTALFGLSGCYLTEARFTDARAVAMRGYATGRATQAFRFLITAADSSLAAADSASGNNWYVMRRARAFGIPTGERPRP